MTKTSSPKSIRAWAVSPSGAKKWPNKIGRFLAVFTRNGDAAAYAAVPHGYGDAVVTPILITLFDPIKPKKKKKNKRGSKT